jgi:hypothetical protein
MKKKFQYDISIEAASEQEAVARMKALIVLTSLLSEKELSKLAHLVKFDPDKTALAKKYLGL